MRRNRERSGRSFFAGNHKPALRTVDEAIRRCIDLIPFTVTIPADKRDKDLSEKLKAEWPGILQWAIEGCSRSPTDADSSARYRRHTRAQRPYAADLSGSAGGRRSAAALAIGQKYPIC